MEAIRGAHKAPNKLSAKQPEQDVRSRVSASETPEGIDKEEPCKDGIIGLTRKYRLLPSDK